MSHKSLAKQIGVIKKLHISSESKITSSLTDTPQIQKLLKFDQGDSTSPVTSQKASYNNDVRELAEY